MIAARSPKVPRKFKKAWGGTLDPTDPTQKAASSTTPAAAGIASAAGSLANFIPTAPSPDGHVKGGAMAAKDGLKYGAEGAEIGSVIPGVGTVIGGAVGLVGGVTAGLISAGAQNRKANAYDRYNQYMTQLNSQQQGAAMYAANPNAKYGNTNSQDFAVGGTLPATTQTPPLSPKFRSEWNGFSSWMKTNGHANDPNLDVRTKNTGVGLMNQYIATNHTTQLSPDSISRAQQEMQDYKNTTWNKIAAGKIQSDAKSYEQYMPNISPVDGWLGTKTANEQFPVGIVNNKVTGFANPLAVATNAKLTYAKGGSIHIKPSHEGRFTDYKERTGKTTEEALHSKDPHVRKMANFAVNIGHTKKAFGGTLDDNLAPDSSVPIIKKVPTPEVSVKQFYNNYLNSPNYKVRLLGQGYNDPNGVITDRLNNLNSTKVVNTPGGGSEYKSRTNTVDIDKKDLAKYKVNLGDLYAHELAHPAGADVYTKNPNLGMNSNDNMLINSVNKLSNYQGSDVQKQHDAHSRELKADMDNLRYNLKQSGIYDTGTQNFNQDYLNKAKQKFGNDGNFKRLQQRLSDKDLIMLMNTVADNTKPDTIAPQVAKFGGRLKYGLGGQTNDSLPPTQQVPGGSLTPVNSTTTQVNGDSHAQGGVQLPQAEVEGGETISNGFVFSKELGFADLHKPIARAMGKIETKPMNPVRRQTLSILKGREMGLAMAQETMKHAMGLPSDLTGGR